jgi:signal transduction histidine kinase
VLFAPTRPRERAPVRALDAYEEAMGRLRDRGEELSREHEEERRRMEVELREKEAMARAGELTAGIVHEVRNGLGTIVGYARMIEKGEAAAEAGESARIIREECETLEAVVRRFMQFVKQETLELAPFDLARLLSRVSARESRNRPGREVDLQLQTEAPLVGDEEILERAFENLIRNALEAAGPGGHVTVGASSEAGSVLVTIEDDGPGLPPDALLGLRPFFTTKPGGLGLGLPLARKIVTLHRGELGLAARRPHGLVVRVRLPAPGSPS